MTHVKCYSDVCLASVSRPDPSVYCGSCAHVMVFSETGDLVVSQNSDQFNANLQDIAGDHYSYYLQIILIYFKLFRISAIIQGSRSNRDHERG